MKHLANLLKWDIILFNRNKIFLLAVVVAAIYMGVFFLLKEVANLDLMLIVLIFNDPVVTGFLFSAVILLFDKNQNTLQAIFVLPLQFENYLLSKSLILSFLASSLAFIMALVMKGTGFNAFHLFNATFLSAFIFCLFGFMLASYAKNFNQLLAYSIPFLIISGIPFAPLLGLGKLAWFFMVPSTGGVGLLKAAFAEMPLSETILMYVYLVAWCLASWVLTQKVTLKKLI